MKSEIVSSKKLAIGCEKGHLYMSNDYEEVILCTNSDEALLNGVVVCSTEPNNIGDIATRKNINYYFHFTGELKLTQ